MADCQRQTREETKVLVCMDRSETAQKAFNWYMDTFYNPSHKVVICHVPEYWGDVQRMMSPARIMELVEQTNCDTKELETRCSRMCAERHVGATFEALKGNEVWNEICKYAKQINADVIVIGTRGMGAIKRTLLGSVSDGVLHHCHVPILIYKE